jgi:hypothetical protein
MDSRQVDGVLLRWGQELFYPHARKARPGSDGALPWLHAGGHVTAGTIRERIKGVVRGAPQVVVKITGGGCGMRAILRHLNYITRRCELPLTDEDGQEHRGRDGLRHVADLWRYCGSLIHAEGDRREALQITLGMTADTNPQALQAAAAAFAAQEFAGYRYAWVYHGDQANPHVHLAVRIESKDMRQRLHPGPADLHRWRERFALALRDRGIKAEATRRSTHGTVKDDDPIWRVKARAAGTLRHDPHEVTMPSQTMEQALTAWGHVHNALAASPDPADRQLAREVKSFLVGTPMVRHLAGRALAQERRQQRAQEAEQRQRQDQAQAQSQAAVARSFR